MPIPDLVRRAAEKQILAYCERRIPAHIRSEMRLETVTEGNAIILVERRPPWRPKDDAQDWTSQGIARFRYEPRLGAWSLFWADRQGRWQRYDHTEPSLDVEPLLAEVDRDPRAIFWG